MSSFFYVCDLQTTKQYEPHEMVLINHYELLLCCTEPAWWLDLLGIYYWVQYVEWALQAGLVSFLPWRCTLMAPTLLVQLYNCKKSCFSDIYHIDRQILWNCIESVAVFTLILHITNSVTSVNIHHCCIMQGLPSDDWMQLFRIGQK
jgi:hypothetical protein